MRFSAKHLGAGLAATILTGTVVLMSTTALGSQPRPTPAVAEPVRQGLWSPAALDALLVETQASSGEGLDPDDYGTVPLQAARRSGDIAETDARATELALMLADDYANGVIRDRGRYDWHIDTPVVTRDQLTAGLRAAVAAGHVRPWLRSLLPQDSRYAALRSAFVGTGDPALRDRLRVNLERWRWMPRDLGSDHLYVNIPSYTLAVVNGGMPVSLYTVVVGSPRTPTPQLALEASSIVVNPYWNVPDSIARKGLGAGYERISTGGTVRYRQAPGPRNALGKIKIDMPNPHAIYLHDTPSKALFERDSRAFSHGCIRVKDIERLAGELVSRDGGASAAVERAAAGSTTRALPLGHKLPVYLVYFTADVGADGQVAMLDDPYGRDADVLQDLRPAPRMAAIAPAEAGRS